MIWFLIAFGAALWMAIHARWQLYQANHVKNEPGMVLQDAIARIIGGYNFFIDGNPDKTDKALSALREKAHLGYIFVWGRRDADTKDLERYPLGLIDREYWDSFEIEYIKLRENIRGNTCRRRGQPERVDKIYNDIYFSKDQIDKIWLPPSRRLIWRVPFC